MVSVLPLPASCLLKESERVVLGLEKLLKQEIIVNVKTRLFATQSDARSVPRVIEPSCSSATCGPTSIHDPNTEASRSSCDLDVRDATCSG